MDLIVAISAPLLLAALAATAATAVRRRRRLNEAMHELRRPLQALELLIGGLDQARPGVECLRQARYALDELDAAVNRGGSRRSREALDLDQVIDAARARWALARVDFTVGEPSAVGGDPDRLACALDNLIANAIEHGSGDVRVDAAGGDHGARIRVSNGVSPALVPDHDRGSDPRRGHGLRIARRIAAEHGGSLRPPRILGREAVTEIRLPGAARRTQGR